VKFRKNWRTLLIGTLGLILLGTALYSTRTNEPSFQGKKLGALLTQIVDARNEQETLRAINQVQQIGTNAIPFLLQLMRAKDSKTKELVIRILSKQHIFDFRLENDIRKHLRAVLCFEALGTNASAAIPALKGMLSNPETAHFLGVALIKIGPAGVDAVVSGLGSTNIAVRRECAGILGSPGIARFSTNWTWTLARMDALQAHGHIAIPPLLVALNDSDELVRARAAIALGFLGQQPGVVLPALIQNLHEINGWRVPASAAKAIGRFGSDAVSAIPELKKVADHKDLRVREAVEGAIHALETPNTLMPQ